MTYKNALAGLDHGGGKAVIIGDPARLKSEALLRAYGRFVQSLSGRYVTACDVGTYSEDMDVIARECEYATGRTIANGGRRRLLGADRPRRVPGHARGARSTPGAHPAWPGGRSASRGSARSAAGWPATWPLTAPGL